MTDVVCLSDRPGRAPWSVPSTPTSSRTRGSVPNVFTPCPRRKGATSAASPSIAVSGTTSNGVSRAVTRVAGDREHRVEVPGPGVCDDQHRPGRAVRRRRHRRVDDRLHATDVVLEAERVAGQQRILLAGLADGAPETSPRRCRVADRRAAFAGRHGQRQCDRGPAGACPGLGASGRHRNHRRLASPPGRSGRTRPRRRRRFRRRRSTPGGRRSRRVRPRCRARRPNGSRASGRPTGRAPPSRTLPTVT